MREDRRSDIVPEVGTIVVVLIVLLALTAATVVVAALDLSAELHVAAAMGIAAIKSVLVAVYFMHLSHEDRVIRVMVIGGILLLALLLAFVLVDVFNRGGA